MNDPDAKKAAFIVVLVVVVLAIVLGVPLTLWLAD